MKKPPKKATAKDGIKKPRTKKEETETPRKPPSQKWVITATDTVVKEVEAYFDQLLAESVVGWAQGDLFKALTYMIGILQATASQLGRIESILTHTGLAQPDLPKHLRRTMFVAAFSTVCNMANPHNSAEEVSQMDLDNLISIISRTSTNPNITKNVNKTPASVIALPVIKK